MKRAEIIPKLAEAYGLEAAKIMPAQKGYRNESYAIKTDNANFNIILYKIESGIRKRIESAEKVAQILDTAGFPVRIQISKKIAVLKSADNTQYAALYNYLPGQTISWEAYTKDHLRALGLTLATMHNELREVTKSNPFNAIVVTQEYSQLVDRMIRYFARAGVKNALASKLQLKTPTNLKTYAKLFAKLKNQDGQHMLHMDFVRGNVLFRTPQTGDRLRYESVAISGILDFEKTAYGAPHFDIARTLAFLLVDSKYKTEAEVRRYFLKSGYKKHGSGKLDNPQIIEWLIDFFLLHDFYKFLLHNPYEYLHQNKHFVRTVAILQKRGKLVAA